MGVAYAFRRRVRGRPAPSEPPAYHPSQEPGIYAFYQGHLSSGSWLDQSGHNRHATQATYESQPADGTDSLSRDCLVFDGSKYLTLPNLSAFTQGSAYLVFEGAADTAASAASSGLWRMGESGMSCHCPWTSGVFYQDFGSTTRYDTGNPSAFYGGGFTITASHIYMCKSTPTRWESRFDGFLLYGTDTNTVGFESECELGRSFDGASHRFNGKVRALAIFSTPLDDDSALMAYLAAV